MAVPVRCRHFLLPMSRILVAWLKMAETRQTQVQGNSKLGVHSQPLHAQRGDGLARAPAKLDVGVLEGVDDAILWSPAGGDAAW